jgi:hypothetical protein
MLKDMAINEILSELTNTLTFSNSISQEFLGHKTSFDNPARGSELVSMPAAIYIHGFSFE